MFRLHSLIVGEYTAKFLCCHRSLKRRGHSFAFWDMSATNATCSSLYQRAVKKTVCSKTDKSRFYYSFLYKRFLYSAPLKSKRYKTMQSCKWSKYSGRTDAPTLRVCVHMDKMCQKFMNRMNSEQKINHKGLAGLVAVIRYKHGRTLCVCLL
jgi:hypothetical protein